MKRNRNKTLFLDSKLNNVSLRNKTEKLIDNTITKVNKDKKLSKTVSTSSKPLTLHGKSQQTNSDEFKISVESSKSNRNLNQYQLKRNCQQGLKKQLLYKSETELPSQKKSKASIQSGSKNINSIEVSICNRGERNDHKKTKKITHTFWESKLTGARRVSKRLTNLKFKNKTSSKQETTSEKYFSKILRPIKKVTTKTQKSITLSAFHNKFKINRKTTDSNSVSTNNQFIISPLHETLIDNKEIPSNKVSNQNELKSSENNTRLLRSLNKHCKPENTGQNNASSGSNKQLITSDTAPSSNVEKVRSFPFHQDGRVFDQGNGDVCQGEKVIDQGEEAVEQCEGVADQGERVADQGEEVTDQEGGGAVEQIIHVGLMHQESANLNRNVEENVFSINEIESIVKNVTGTECVNAMQSEYEAMDMEVLVVDIEADNTSSNIPQVVNGSILSEFHEENDQNQKISNDSTDDLKPSVQNSSDEIKLNTCTTESKDSLSAKKELVVEDVLSDSKANKNF